jgi:hypothetical protein
VLVALMDAADVHSVIAGMLKCRGRSLSETQTDKISKESQQEPSALYLSLAVTKASTWSSFKEHYEAILSSGVRPLIKQFFFEAEKGFGPVVIRVALGFITMSMAGLSDNELLDLVSLHEGAMTEVNQYAIENRYKLAQRLPSHVWSRIRHSFAGLLVEREEGRLFWYHRQLHETAVEVYGDPTVDRSISEILGRYFGNLIPIDVCELKSITPQPLVFAADENMVWFPDTVVNKRRCVEAVRHLRIAGLLAEAKDELCRVTGISARAKCGK